MKGAGLTHGEAHEVGGIQQFNYPAHIINVSNSPNAEGSLRIRHNQPGIGFFKISVVFQICVTTEIRTFRIKYAWAHNILETVIAVIIGTESCQAYHLIFVFAAVIVVMMLSSILTMVVTIMVTRMFTVIIVNFMT